MDHKKKLIEVALPLEEINEASAREKSIRHGHPSTLHFWWARRPLATARAVLWSSLVDDPSSHPDQFPTEEDQKKERERLFGILERLVKWENLNNEEVLSEAKAEIFRSTCGNPPPLLDPFAGGGAIPLEAQRLGLEAHASDLNPVAVMINKAMIEIPPKFANQPPIHPVGENEQYGLSREWKGAQGLAEDVRYYSEWMKQKAWERIGYLYPKAKDEHEIERTVIAWIWARTVKCPNPACGAQMPLANSFELSNKKGKEAFIQPIVEGKQIRYKVRQGKGAPEPPKIAQGRFKCTVCGEPVASEYVKTEGKAKRIGKSLMAIVTEGQTGRLYVSPSVDHLQASEVALPDWVPEGELQGKAADQLPLYGYTLFSELFTNRQLIALTTFSDLVSEAVIQIEKDGGTSSYGQSLAVYLSFIVDKLAQYHSSFCSWDITRDGFRNTFGRQAIAMVWDFAEGNPFSNSSGSYNNMQEWVVKSIQQLPASSNGYAVQHDARAERSEINLLISTDPPYYDNICYGDLSDFFYLWLRRNLIGFYPSLFKTVLVPKTDELIASSYRFDGNQSKAKQFFEDGMLKAFQKIFITASEEFPVSVYYAYKQSEEESGSTFVSSGWETMLTAILDSGFSINGTWPVRTELANRIIGRGANALASSIILVCRKRPDKAPISTRRGFINTLKQELKPALKKLQAANIAPVDLAQSAIGPGMAVYSRYSQVLEADGTPMSMRSALQIINQELDLFFTEQDGELDSESRFCIDLYTQYAFNDIKFGEADVLARAKNTSVEKLAGRGVLYAERGVVRLLTREEIPAKPDKEIIWLLTQQLTHAMETNGVAGTAQIVAKILTSEPERAKALAYRLYTIAERKKWTAEAFAYNSLVTAWPDVQHKAAQLRSTISIGEQQGLFD